ncbi:MAG: hypothetical protein J7M32_01350 [Deltaproteobacteria bacterium]|nr:hypothetical protein [Deltaproteobacteria bacterium]
MSILNNPVKILKLLDRLNCGECGEKTCLAFAGAVNRGWEPWDECPGSDPKSGSACSVRAGFALLLQKALLRHM